MVNQEDSPLDYLEVVLDRAGAGDEVEPVKAYRNVGERTVFEAVIVNPEDPDRVIRVWARYEDVEVG